jgi:hypothetical protein
MLVHNELERILQGVAVAPFQILILFWHLPGGTEKNHETPQLGELVIWARFEPHISQT